MIPESLKFNHWLSELPIPTCTSPARTAWTWPFGRWWSLGWSRSMRGIQKNCFKGHIFTLVFQIPYEDRCLDPQTPPEVRCLGVPNTDPHKVFGGFWKTRVSWKHGPNCWTMFLGWVGNHESVVPKNCLNRSKQWITLEKWAYSRGCSNFENWQLAGGLNPFEKYARQIGSFPQVGVKIKHIWNHQIAKILGKISYNS